MSQAKKPRVKHGAVQISIVFAYYENPQMLELQWREIAAYPRDVKKNVQIVVVDDGSPQNPAALVRRPKSLPDVAIFRLGVDIPWNQDAARNIGAFEASGTWLLLTDIDHVVPAETLKGLLSMQKDPDVVYSFGRVKFDSGEVREPHPNSYFMTKKMYWSIGGHDEDFAGIYGKDVLFRQRVLKKAREVPLTHLPLARVGTTLVPDAGTTLISRENTASKRLLGIVLEWLKKAKLYRGVQTLRYPYTREL